MGEKNYTRTGIVTNDRAPFRQYIFPIANSTNDNIRFMIPYTATKADIEEALEHLSVIAKHWINEE